jgi:predicted amidohydrolase
MSAIKPNTSPFFAGFLQFDVHRNDIVKNFSQVRKGLLEISAPSKQVSPGIIVMPELWATDFDYEKLPDLVKKIPELLLLLQELSAKHQMYLVGSLPELSNSSYYNTLYITGPNGIAGTYRKQKLFSPMAEDSFFTPGTDPYPIQTTLGPVAGLVCYDLRFPELLRNQVALGANLLVVPAQWPAARVNHWRILLQARAIENQMFVVAANRCGTTGETTFGGHSMIVGPDGTILLEAGKGAEYSGIMLDPAMTSAARSLFSTVPITK